MDHDDPEKRIAELERQLAQPSETGATAPRRLTAEQVRKIAFSAPRFGRRGYNEDEVDAFLDVVAAALEDPAGSTLTQEHVHNIAFSKPRLGRRGYNEDEVDVFLEMLEEELKIR